MTIINVLWFILFIAFIIGLEVCGIALLIKFTWEAEYNEYLQKARDAE